MGLKRMVGERGFEPPTPWSRTRCSTRLSHSPTLMRRGHAALNLPTVDYNIGDAAVRPFNLFRSNDAILIRARRWSRSCEGRVRCCQQRRFFRRMSRWLREGNLCPADIHPHGRSCSGNDEMNLLSLPCLLRAATNERRLYFNSLANARLTGSTAIALNVGPDKSWCWSSTLLSHDAKLMLNEAMAE